MSRVINTNSPGKARQQLLKALLNALNDWGKIPSKNEDDRLDLAAFITLTLNAITKTVETTTAAWEKRDYWIKAEKFQQEWMWAQILATKLRKNIINKDWKNIEKNITEIDIATKALLKNSTRTLHGQLWKGAYQKLLE